MGFSKQLEQKKRRFKGYEVFRNGIDDFEYALARLGVIR